ncbi:retinol dehydrogenase 16-like [Mauremys reevesii]|uniref:retinol dehydrogenase 16-like n=1 Tax=Mauremys reevesii TaxID=260615 RepID=UPI00193FB05F|nr:retinol dehydrogenase 16-like [Mauremys reevesii]XP_039370507.1 retinol dehydrogenase 16-like [Mauremys reevesii]XP_039370508.1 retinol dehydrogenase 16-like [Mauremys reevesii]
MWLYLAALLGLYFLRRWYRERQRVEGLPEKYVLITGCDSGFGNLLAKQLDARGLRVLAACLSQPGAEQLRKATSERLQTVILDVTRSDSIAAASAWVKERVGEKGLWGLVNNAGIAIPAAPNEWLTKDDFVRVLDVNLIGLIEVTLSVLPLVKRARGRVVSVASIMGRLAFFGGGYCPSKYGVEAFSDSLRREMLPFGVKVCVIEPGYFSTAVTNPQLIIENFTRLWERLPEETKASYGESYLKAFIEATRDLPKSCNSDLSVVTGCLEHALTARHPRTRYSAGWDAKLFFLPLSYLPTWFADFVLTWSYPAPAQKV